MVESRKTPRTGPGLMHKPVADRPRVARVLKLECDLIDELWSYSPVLYCICDSLVGYQLFSTGQEHRGVLRYSYYGQALMVFALQGKIFWLYGRRSENYIQRKKIC